MLRRLLIALTTVTAVSACSASPQSSGPAASPTPAPPSPVVSASPVELRAGQSCPDLTSAAKAVRFTVDGSDLYGLILGSGRTGVVISHMRNDNVCQPAPLAKEIAALGYRVLLFDFAGYGVSPASAVPRHKQVAAAVAALRSDGVGSVALIGGSMGATATLAAAAAIRPPVRAVVALSPPLVFADDDALSAAPKLTMPTLYGAGESDRDYSANIRRLGDLTPRSTKHVVRIIPGSSVHGLWLTDPEQGDRALRAEVFAFLTSNAPISA